MIAVSHAFNAGENKGSQGEIDLLDDNDRDQGSTGGVKPRSVSLSPVSATIDAEKVKVSFTSNVGNVSIVIKSNSGAEYYSGSVDTSLSNNVIIDISAFPSGEYIITIKTVNDILSKYGEFIID